MAKIKLITEEEKEEELAKLKRIEKELKEEPLQAVADMADMALDAVGDALKTLGSSLAEHKIEAEKASLMRTAYSGIRG